MILNWNRLTIGLILQLLIPQDSSLEEYQLVINNFIDPSEFEGHTERWYAALRNNIAEINNNNSILIPFILPSHEYTQSILSCSHYTASSWVYAEMNFLRNDMIGCFGITCSD